MEIDYFDTQLPDDELREVLSKRKQDAMREAEASKKRRAKMNDFRFKGGML